MNSDELYDELYLEFPAIYPQSSKWQWINVHNGEETKLDTINELLDSNINSSEVFVLVHSEPGIAVKLPKRNVATFITGFVLEHDIQISDLNFASFVSISRYGVATSDVKFAVKK